VDSEQWTVNSEQWTVKPRAAGMSKSPEKIFAARQKKGKNSKIRAFSGGGFLPCGTTRPYSCGKRHIFNLPIYAINPFVMNMMRKFFLLHG
jgi:hypothetical protein